MPTTILVYLTCMACVPLVLCGDNATETYGGGLAVKPALHALTSSWFIGSSHMLPIFRLGSGASAPSTAFFPNTLSTSIDPLKQNLSMASNIHEAVAEPQVRGPPVVALYTTIPVSSPTRSDDSFPVGANSMSTTPEHRTSLNLRGSLTKISSDVSLTAPVHQSTLNLRGSLFKISNDNFGARDLMDVPIVANSKSTLFQRVFVRLYYILMLASCLVVIFMMQGPGGNNNSEFNHRRPPAWGPEMESVYSFRAYVTDLMHWVLLTDLQPHQQAAAILMRLQGSARELARTISGPEILNGGVYEGVQYDPVSFIIAGLRGRYGQLDEETRMAAMTEMLAFSRHPQETINMVLSRFELVRGRARGEGQFVMSIEGSALQLMRACHVSPPQMLNLLQPFNHQLPHTEEEFRQLQQTMRRIGHILERSPNNVGQALGGNREARRGQYMALQDAARNTPTMNTYFGSQGFAQQDTDNMFDWNIVEPSNDYQPVSAFPSWSGHEHDPWGGASLPASGDPFGSWSQDGSWQQPSQSFPAMASDGGDESCDSGTDTDTSSDSGNEEVDMTDLRDLSEEQAADQCFFRYRFAKRKWRRFTGKRVRKVRRKFKRSQHAYFKGKRGGPRNKFGKGGKGHFGGHGRRTGHVFLTHDDMHVYLKGKGKGHRVYTSGMAHGRRGNPKGRDGQTMKCHGCGSTDHLLANCPTKKGGKGAGASMPPPNFLTNQPWSSGPACQNDHMAPTSFAATASSTPLPAAPWYYTQGDSTAAEQGPLDELLGVSQPAYGARDAASTFMVLENPNSSTPAWNAENDPWHGANLPPPPTSPSPSPSRDTWGSYIPVNATNADYPASSSAQPSMPMAGEPADVESEQGVTAEPTAAPAPIIAASPGFLSQADLQDVLLRGRTALERASRFRPVQDQILEQQAQTVPGYSIFGAPLPAPPPVTADTLDTNADLFANIFAQGNVTPPAITPPRATTPPVVDNRAEVNIGMNVAAPTTGSNIASESLGFLNQLNRARSYQNRGQSSLLFGEGGGGVLDGVAPAAGVTPYQAVFGVQPPPLHPVSGATIVDTGSIANLAGEPVPRQLTSTEPQTPAEALLAQGRADFARLQQASAFTRAHTTLPASTTPQLPLREQFNVVRNHVRVGDTVHRARLDTSGFRTRLVVEGRAYTDNGQEVVFPTEVIRLRDQDGVMIPILEGVNGATTWDFRDPAPGEHIPPEERTSHARAAFMHIRQAEAVLRACAGLPPDHHFNVAELNLLARQASVGGTLTTAAQNWASTVDDRVDARGRHIDSSEESFVEMSDDDLDGMPTLEDIPPNPVDPENPVDVSGQPTEWANNRRGVTSQPMTTTDNIDQALIHATDVESCTICLTPYEHGGWVLRLQCGHMFHAGCWNTFQSSTGHAIRRETCPVCRGRAVVVAVWQYYDTTNEVLTQDLPDGSSAPNNLEEATEEQAQSLAQVESHVLMTPRSVATVYDFQTPNTQRSGASVMGSIHSTPTFAGIILPSTFQDFREWCVTPSGSCLAKDGFSQVPYMPEPTNPAESFHTETRLRDGRPAILIDPGSVGNLGGDRWAQIVAKLALEHQRNPNKLFAIVHCMFPVLATVIGSAHTIVIRQWPFNGLTILTVVVCFSFPLCHIQIFLDCSA